MVRAAAGAGWAGDGDWIELGWVHKRAGHYAGRDAEEGAYVSFLSITKRLAITGLSNPVCFFYEAGVPRKLCGINLSVLRRLLLLVDNA